MATRRSGRCYHWLLEHVDYDGEGCLIWPFPRNKFWGRAQFGVDGKIEWAHRYMCKLVHGDPPPDKPYAAHECGNGHLGCVHPKHLFWKTSSENARLIVARMGDQKGVKADERALRLSRLRKYRRHEGVFLNSP